MLECMIVSKYRPSKPQCRTRIEFGDACRVVVRRSYLLRYSLVFLKSWLVCVPGMQMSLSEKISAQLGEGYLCNNLQTTIGPDYQTLYVTRWDSMHPAPANSIASCGQGR
jgi:hypothetical protein